MSGRSISIRWDEAGATWLDANAGTAPQREPEDLIWLVENIQAVVDTPIALDSANPKALQAAIKVVKKKPLINSISLEPNRLDVFPIGDLGLRNALIRAYRLRKPTPERLQRIGARWAPCRTIGTWYLWKTYDN